MSSSTQENCSGVSATRSVENILSTKDIDVSCRFPVFVFFISAALWFLISNLLGLIVSIKLHAPGFLAHCPWLTYGRVFPVQQDLLVYGFAVPSAVGVMVWLLCRLGQIRLKSPFVLLLSAKAWNIGVLLGCLGVLSGNSTGFEWLEFPRYSSLLLFISYLLMGIWAVATFHARQRQQLFPTQWYFLAAIFWFAWIYSAANMLLIFSPVRGVVQLCVNAWFSSNLLNVWLSFVGVGTLFYFLPKMTNRPLHSYYLAQFAFWGIALLGGWGNLNVNAPLPSWIPSLSAVMGTMMIIPTLCVVLNVRGTLSGYKSANSNPILSLMIFGAFCFVLAQFMGILQSIRPINERLAFTYFSTAQTHWMLVGFFASIMFGAVYYIVPLLLNVEPVAVGKIRLQAGALVGGILIYGVALTVNGIVQGSQLNDAKVGFPEVIKSTLPALHISTLGSFILVIAALLFVSNLLLLLGRAGCACWNSKKSEVRS